MVIIHGKMHRETKLRTLFKYTNTNKLTKALYGYSGSSFFFFHDDIRKETNARSIATF